MTAWRSVSAAFLCRDRDSSRPSKSTETRIRNDEGRGEKGRDIVRERERDLASVLRQTDK
jgi:hypothetical protein